MTIATGFRQDLKKKDFMPTMVTGFFDNPETNNNYDCKD